MINGKLQDFAASAMARGQISFGDVRRLQRDCLPHGITTRDEAESLIALDAKLVRADKAWAEWLVPALAEFAIARQVTDLSGSGATLDLLQGLIAPSPASAALGRKIARYIRRRSAQQQPDEGTDAPQRARRKVSTCKVERSVDGIAPIIRSDIGVRPGRRSAARPKERVAFATGLPCEIWSAAFMQKHMRFQLARPAA